MVVVVVEENHVTSGGESRHFQKPMSVRSALTAVEL